MKEMTSKEKKGQVEQVKYFWSMKEIDGQVHDAAAVLIKMLKKNKIHQEHKQRTDLAAVPPQNAH